MLITKETDYALRLLRGLLSGEQKTAGELAEQEQYQPSLDIKF